MSAAASWSVDEFEARLREQGSAYHIHHPFNVMLNSGSATREQIQGWVANRFYYQISIPRKDAAILSNCPDRAVRRIWIERILDHDGHGEDAGGIESWLRLAAAVGLGRAEVEDLKHLLPGVRFAVDAYLNFARQQPWQEAVCSSLTELFATEIHKQRLASWPEHYPWIDRDGLQYFRSRVPLAQRDVGHGLAVTLAYFTTREQQERALQILKFKLDILWAMNDAMAQHYGADMSSDGRPAIAKGFRLQWEAVQNAHVLLYPEGMVRLNSSAGEILRRCDGSLTVDEITTEVEAAFKAEALGAQVARFLTFAVSQGWVSLASS